MTTAPTSPDHQAVVTRWVRTHVDPAAPEVDRLATERALRGIWLQRPGPTTEVIVWATWAIVRSHPHAVPRPSDPALATYLDAVAVSLDTAADRLDALLRDRGAVRVWTQVLTPGLLLAIEVRIAAGDVTREAVIGVVDAAAQVVLGGAPSAVMIRARARIAP